MASRQMMSHTAALYNNYTKDRPVCVTSFALRQAYFSVEKLPTVSMAM